MCWSCLLHDIHSQVLLPYFDSWLALSYNVAESELCFLSLLGSGLTQNGTLSQNKFQYKSRIMTARLSYGVDFREKKRRRFQHTEISKAIFWPEQKQIKKKFFARMGFYFQYIFLNIFFSRGFQSLMQKDTCYTICSKTLAASLPQNGFTC